MVKRTNNRKEDKSSGGICCLRFTLGFFNFFTMLTGFAALGIGVWLFCQQNYHKSSYPEDFRNETNYGDYSMMDITSTSQRTLPKRGEYYEISILLMILGSTVSVISFFGCFGYLSSVVMIICLQSIIGVLIVVYREPVGKSLRSELYTGLKNYQPSNSTAKPWDILQREFKCCGVRDYKDWFGVPAWPRKNYVPDSCCVSNYPGCGKMFNPSLFYNDGCLERVQRWFFTKLHILGSVVIFLLFLQLYGLIASIILFASLKSKSSSSSTKNSSKLYKTYPYERTGIM